MRLLLLALVPALFATTAFAQRDLKDIPDPDPEIERQSFIVADGFEVNLFAADPLLAKPIQMNFDAAGRLWVATSEVYPQIPPGQKANDKIIILEDSDGDGRADKTTVFADGLLIPTGVEPDAVTRMKDGRLASSAYVANSTEIVHFTDSDGDGRADESRIVLSGFGTEDTHHIIHSFRWGPDGCLYFNQSIYIHSHIETPWGVRRLGGGGIWRFRPDSWQLDVLCRGFVNAWGHAFDDYGQSFATDGAFGEGINYVFPGAVFFSAPGATRILKGLNPGSPKHCGLEIVGGRHLPDDWQGNMLTNDFRGNRVCRFVVTEDGAGFASREMPELIKTKHVAFRPIDIKMGPDGAIYIADWYNPIIQHGEVDFRDPRRDHTHGRIWRVTAKGRPLVPRPKLVDASIEELLDHLKSPEAWTRHFAKRVLKERDPEAVVPVLLEWKGKLDRGDPHFDSHRLEAYWALQSHDAIPPIFRALLLQAKDPRVRAAVTRTLGQPPIERSAEHVRDFELLIEFNAPSNKSRRDELTKLVVDPHPRVRLEAVRALGGYPLEDRAKSAEIAMRAMDFPDGKRPDQFLDYALWLTARELEPHWLPAMLKGEVTFGGNARHQVFALEAVGTPSVVKPLTELLQRGEVPADREDAVLALIGSQGDPAALAAIFNLAVTEEPVAPGRRTMLIESLTKATRQRRLVPGGDLGRLAALVGAADETLGATAARAAGLWKAESIRPQLTDLAGATNTKDSLRRAAFDGLALLGGDASRTTLDAIAASDRPLPVRALAAAALVAVDLKAAASRAAELLANADVREGEATGVFNSFLQQKAGPAALATALADRKLPPDTAKIGVRLAKISGREQPDLITALTKAGSITGGVRQLSPDEMAAMVDDVRERGDAARGEIVYRRADLNCLKCHAISGAGGLVGPDLVSIGASAPMDYLVDSMLDPNKKVKEGFHSLVIATNDGKILTGIKARESDSEIVIRDADAREVAIPRSSIEEVKNGGSIMPAGLTDPLTHQEFVDLVRFMSELGKPGPYSTSKARIVRRWDALDMTPDALEIVRHENYDLAVSMADKFRWSPAYSKVAGDLPLDGLPRTRVSFGEGAYDISFVRFRLAVSTPGRVKLRFNSPDGVRLWLDGKPLDPKSLIAAASAPGRAAELPLDLAAGTHTIIALVRPGQRREPLHVELDDAPGSAAQVQIVPGN